ncbi:MAG: 4-hydroxy-tetrahydrodipicolinate reductase [Nitriliruptoraceae bacterium]
MNVAVIGAAGRMGTEVCRAVSACQDLTLAAAVDPARAGQRLDEVIGISSNVIISGSLEELDVATIDCAVEFTGPATVAQNLCWLLEHGIHTVVGATGLTDDAIETARTCATRGGVNALIAPNFAIGAVLLERFAKQAVAYFPHVEVIELHHDQKVDAPSGTALRTAQLLGDARTTKVTTVGGDERHPGARGATVNGVAVHSVRLPGLIAHEEVIFGGEGEILTLRHDSLSRTSFMPGVLHAIRHVATLDGVAVGLDQIL